MATDMDIEMDIDVGLTAEDFTVPEIDILPDVQAPLDHHGTNPILNAPDDSKDSVILEPSPHKVHIRGLDNLTTKDIRSFAAEHFPDYSPENVEWIDDASANLVYGSARIAEDALRAFIAVEVTDISQIPLLQSLAAKQLSLHPQTNLAVRRAVVGDRKQPRARERSRFYLFNPEHDPAERRRERRQGERRYRDRDDDGYRSQRYDDHEQQNRIRDAENSGFDASLYDDDADALAKRRGGDSSSSTDSRQVRSRGPAGRELFPGRNSENGRLRGRSASPLRSDDRTKRSVRDQRKGDDAALENRKKAQLIKARLRDTGSKELFPQKVNSSRGRSSAFDAADETADLFADKMSVPFSDDDADVLSPDTASNQWNNITGFNIRGAAKASATKGFTIKGAASGGEVKELFPTHFGDNAGKELFSGGFEGRGQRRQKAEDLFH